MDDFIDVGQENTKKLSALLAEKHVNIKNVVVPINDTVPAPVALHVIGIDEIISMPAPPIDYLLWPIMPTQGIGFVYAATGMGKTLFGLNLAYSIAGGGSFLKYKCPKPRSILYIDGEMSYPQIHQRIIDIYNQQGKLDFPSNWNLLTTDKQELKSLPQIDVRENQHIYNALIKERNIEVIIIDNLSVLTSIDENSAKEWKAVQDWFLSLRAMGKSIIFLHHAGKDKTGFRGTSRMMDTADFAISLQPMDETEGDEADRGKKIKIVYEKNRIFFGQDAAPYEAYFIDGRWSYKAAATLFEKVVECKLARMTQGQTAKELHITQPYVSKLLNKARERHLIP